MALPSPTPCLVFRANIPKMFRLPNVCPLPTHSAIRSRSLLQCQYNVIKTAELRMRHRNGITSQFEELRLDEDRGELHFGARDLGVNEATASVRGNRPS